MLDGDKNSLTASILNEAASAISGIPAPIQKGLVAAIHRLCLAGVELPVAYLEGLADERRAVTAARAALASSVGASLASGAEVDQALSQSAYHVYARKILGRQSNVDAVVKSAVLHAANVALEPPKQQEDEPSNETVSNDWLNQFEREAESASSEELQEAFGRILAGECRSPGSFSRATLRVMSQLSQETASDFQILCNLATRVRSEDGRIFDARVWDLGVASGDNALSQYGVTYSMLCGLMEAGLILTELESGLTYGTLAQGPNGFLIGAFEYSNVKWGLVAAAAAPSSVSAVAKRFSGISFTRAGRELSDIVTVEEDESYTAALKTYLAESHLVRCEVRWDPERGSYGHRIDA